MNITIHRGTHEIGGSCVELSSGKSRILLDFGIPLVKVGGGGVMLTPVPTKRKI